ncbi:HK97 family phage prohead protease [Nitrobacter winogradskyi]|uniref:HK97 family phage prohead protease n=1 Tax=Nitrobacter winogradskyi TaxID=913 RepID=A0ACC6AEH7_NITWI|nr:HK97 family phage prohead protease [Nitrobacter winogradskyi]
MIAPGAFEKTLKDARSSGNWPAMLLQHGSFLGGDDNMPVGVWTEMREDSKGLYVEGQLAPTTRGKDAYTLLKMSPRPAINGMSIGYRPVEWSMRAKPEDPRRTLKAVELLEVSLVTFPANGKARVEAVKSADSIKTIREFEEFLRDVGGFSNAAAKAIAAGGFKANPRDEDANMAAIEIVRRNLAILTRK